MLCSTLHKKVMKRLVKKHMENPMPIWYDMGVDRKERQTEKNRSAVRPTAVSVGNGNLKSKFKK